MVSGLLFLFSTLFRHLASGHIFLLRNLAACIHNFLTMQSSTCYVHLENSDFSTIFVHVFLPSHRLIWPVEACIFAMFPNGLIFLSLPSAFPRQRPMVSTLASSTSCPACQGVSPGWASAADRSLHRAHRQGCTCPPLRISSSVGCLQSLYSHPFIPLFTTFSSATVKSSKILAFFSDSSQFSDTR